MTFDRSFGNRQLVQKVAYTPRMLSGLHANVSGADADQIMRWASGEVYNVKAYGAIGNGVANDTAAIQAAITAAYTAGGGEVFLPPGTYLITSLILRQYVSLRGVGPRSVTLDAQGSGAAIYTSEQLNGQYIGGFKLTHANNTNSTVDMIDIRYGMQRCRVEDIFFYSNNGVTQHGFRLRGEYGGAESPAFFNTLSNLCFETTDTACTGTAIYMEGSTTYGVNNNTIILGIISGFATGIYISGAANTIINTSFDPNLTTGITIYQPNGDAQCFANAAINCYWDGDWSAKTRVLIDCDKARSGASDVLPNITIFNSQNCEYPSYISLSGDQSAGALFALYGPLNNYHHGYNAYSTKSVTSSSNITMINPTYNQHFEHTLTENTIIGSTTDWDQDVFGQHIGREITVILKQAATGGPYSVTWGGEFAIEGGVYTMTPTAGKRDIFHFIWDGTDWLEVSRAQDV